jgi:REP-associated tyrosine transposase
MPRANRHFLPGYVWHITHHAREAVPKFQPFNRYAQFKSFQSLTDSRNIKLNVGSFGNRDRRRYLHWAFEAKKRFGLSVLNYVVTCNHVHLLVKDTGRDVISQSIQLIAGRTAQEYNQRKNRQGAFWEDRYHATAIEADEHLHRCLVYIDLNMVPAGVVNHPIRWKHGGYREIQDPPERYALLDLKELTALCGLEKVGDFQEAHRDWVDEAIKREWVARESRWSEAVAVGSLSFVNTVKSELGFKAAHQPRGGGSTVQRFKVQSNTGLANRRLTVHMRSASTVKLTGPILPAKMRC